MLWFLPSLFLPRLHREKDHTSSEDEMETIAKLTEQRNKLVEESRQEGRFPSYIAMVTAMAGSCLFEF